MKQREEVEDLVQQDKSDGFFGLLTIVFIVLKLTGVIAWSWWWVLAPIWIPVLISAVVVFIVWIVACFTTK